MNPKFEEQFRQEGFTEPTTFFPSANFGYTYF